MGRRADRQAKIPDVWRRGVLIAAPVAAIVFVLLEYFGLAAVSRVGWVVVGAVATLVGVYFTLLRLR
jgi:hypothetical protein